MARLLLVEDDALVRQALIRHLSHASHVVRSAGTALEALREVQSCAPDLVVLDLGLPDIDGAQVLRMIRSSSDVPVIVATGRKHEKEVVRLLHDGADDYLVKPFSPQHLVARIAALLRRTTLQIVEEVVVGDLRIDIGRRRVILDSTLVDLTRREFDLLLHLALHAGQVISKKELLSTVWQRSYLDEQTVDVHVSQLRRKLGESAREPRYIHTVRGVGLVLEAPAQDA